MGKKTAPLVYVIAFLSGLGGFLFGYDTGVISGALLFLRVDFALDTFQQEIVVATLLLFAAIGAILAGRMADRFGRRPTIISAAGCFIIGAIVMTAAPSFWVLIVGRAIVGLAIGIASMTVPLYVSELAPPHLRGMLVSVNQLLITIGIVIAYIVDLSFAPSGGWRWMLGLSIIPAAVLFLAMFFLPETPRWYLGHDRENKARGVLARLGLVKDEIEEMVRKVYANLAEEAPGLREMFAKSMRKPLALGMLIMFFQQVTGINTVIYYAPTIFEIAGFKGAVSALIATSTVGVMNVVMTIVALCLIDRVGRRPLLLWGTSAMVVGLFVLGLDWFFPDNPFKGAVAIASLVVYIAGFAIGLGPIAWLLIAEFYPLKVRGTAMSWSVFVNWIFNFGVALTFLTILQAIGPSFTFWLYAALSVATVLFVFFFIPETKGKTLEEIERSFKHADI